MPAPGSSIPGVHGYFEFDPWMLGGHALLLDPGIKPAATAFEQSNSSIAYGEQVMAKLYRRLEIGQNIEVDMNRYLAAEAGFDSIPTLIGSATYRGESGKFPGDACPTTCWRSSGCLDCAHGSAATQG